jgi:CRP-like cAMP-binding protein
MAQTLDIFMKFCETMAYVHDRGVIHLDLKPENIMVGRYGEVLVMDWGNARLHNPEPYREYLKATGKEAEGIVPEDEKRKVVLGTPLYMSPEQTNTPRNLLSPSSDIFSAGIVLYEMLTGVRPFQADTSQAAMVKVTRFSPAAVNDVNPDVPVRLSRICMKMLEKQPFDRYRSFADALTDLSELRDAGQAFATREYEAGDVIFDEGAPGEYAFTILSGKVDIVKKTDDGETVLATLGKGEIVGELAIFTEHSRTAAARAAEKTTIRVMSAADVKVELEKMRPWVGQMVSGLSERFIGQNERIVELEKQLSETRNQKPE